MILQIILLLQLQLSTPSFVGFRAVTSQNTDLNISINTVISFNSVSVNTFAYDTQNMFNTTASSYTIPTGYSGYWDFNIHLFIAENSESLRRVHLRVTRGGSTFEPLQVGNYNTQINCLTGTIPVLEGDIIRMFCFQMGELYEYTQQKIIAGLKDDTLHKINILKIHSFFFKNH